MEENKKPLSALSESIENNMRLLQQANERKAVLGNEYYMVHIVNNVCDHTDEINDILTRSKSPKNDLQKLCAGIIVDACDGNLAVPNYQPKGKAEQSIYIYVSTHWSLLDHQEYYDLIKDCCKAMGLSDNWYEDHKFMESLFQSVAFRVARRRTSNAPADVEMVNVANGTIEIKNDGAITFRAHRCEDFFTYCLPYTYDPQAECPMFHAYLDRVIPDKDTQQVLAEYPAYCFTRHLKLEKMLVLYGSGSNGKSVYLDIIEAVFGKENVSNVSLSDLTNDPEKRCAIEHKRVNISFESGKDVNTATLKLIVSGEPVDCRELYVGTHLMREYAKLITSFNAMPKAETTLGFYRRFQIVPFRVEITDDEKDVELAKKIITNELSGILNWILNALAGVLQRKAFTFSSVCQQALERYKLSSDPVKMFASECVVGGGESLTTGKELYAAYKAYCMDEEMYSCGKHKFFDRIEALGYERSEHQRQIFFKLRVDRNG